jgi:RNA polymerase sigma factor (sigma-70 family)
MAISHDMQLLQEYASGNSEEAFATLVSRHINLVYSAALRRVGNPHQAEEITQAVFVVLARKARRLSSATILSGWLYQTARLTAANFLRTEIRRQHREQEAHMQSPVNEPEPELWRQIGPVLDEAMAQLSESDRNAIVLRFFEGKPLKEVGAALGTTDDAAKMRINRAIEKLRTFFLQRGITLSSAGLAASICENSVQAAPAGLAASVTFGVGQSAVLAASTSTLATGTLKLMAWSKLNIAIGVAAVAVMAVEWNQISTTKQKAAQLQEQLQHQTQLNQTQQSEIAKLDERNSALSRQIQSAAHETAKARNRNSMALPAPAGATGTTAKKNAFADMMKDPAMMKFMRDQQATLLKKQYDPLLKQLNLTPEQGDAFYQLLLDNQMNNMQRGASLFSGGGKGDAAQALADSAQELQAGLKNLLGDDGYSQYQDYQSVIAVRMQLDQMKSDFADNPLSDDQEQQLVQAMKTAQSAVAGANNSVKINVTDPSASMEQNLQQQASINQQVLQQAADFLSPAQLQTLGTSQSNLISLERAGYAMAQQMFGAQTNGATASGQ